MRTLAHNYRYTHVHTCTYTCTNNSENQSCDSICGHVHPISWKDGGTQTAKQWP